MIKKKTLDVNFLRALLHYEPETGVFTWVAPLSTRVKPGDVAGTYSNTTGYRYVRIMGSRYAAARLAWAYMTGKFPDEVVDHINRDKTDDRWSNLRLADCTQSNGNQQARRHNPLGLKGVTREPRTGRYYARLMAYGTRWNLGTYATAEEAKAAYDVAARKAFGEFASN